MPTNKYFISILTAFITGIIISCLFLFIFSYTNQNNIKENLIQEKSYENEENAPYDVYSSPIEYDKERIITAQAYILTNIDKNEVIVEKNADTLLPIASIAKLVTAVIALKNIDRDEMIEITKPILKVEGNSARLRLGEKFKLREILYPLLMLSSNDSAEAIALKYGRKKFIKEMNDWTYSIGAYRTYFFDPTGLSSKTVSSARDIAIIAEWIKKNEPEILDITHTKSKIIRTHTWVNPTHFLNLDSYIGGKNGYTPASKNTNVSLFYGGKNKEIYSVVVLGSSAREHDTINILEKAIQ